MEHLNINTEHNKGVTKKGQRTWQAVTNMEYERRVSTMLLGWVSTEYLG